MKDLRSAALSSMPRFYIDDVDRDTPIIVEAFARIYSLAFMMTGDELIAEQLELETRSATAEAIEALHFAEFPEKRLFNRIADAQFIYQCGLFFDSPAGLATPFGTLSVPVVQAVQDHMPMPHVKNTVLRAKVLLLPATERLIYLLCYSLGYPYVDVARLLRFSVETTQRAATNACIMLRELLSGRRAH